MRAEYLNKNRRNLVAFYFSLNTEENIPIKGDFIEYDDLGFEVVLRTINYKKGIIEVRAYCNYEGTELENL